MDTSYLSNERLQERLWSRVDVKPDPDECWEWTGGTSKAGYGMIGYGRYKRFYTHRLAYELIIGPIPENKSLMHSCDNPPCCNPKHLSPGTQADNLKDMFAKNRRPPFRKLNESQIREIVKRYLAGENPKDFVPEYGVSYRAAMHYIMGERRADLFTSQELEALKMARNERRGGRGRWSDYSIKPQ